MSEATIWLQLRRRNILLLELSAAFTNTLQFRFTIQIEDQMYNNHARARTAIIVKIMHISFFIGK